MEKWEAYKKVSKEYLNTSNVDLEEYGKEYLKTCMLNNLKPNLDFKYNVFEDRVLEDTFYIYLKLTLYSGYNLPKFCEGEVISPNLDILTLNLFDLENREYRVMDVWEDNYLLVEEELFDNHLRESQYFRIGRDFVENNFIGSE